MRDQGQQISLPRLDPGGLALEDEVLEGQLLAPRSRRCRRAVLPRNVPFRQLALEVRDKVLLHGRLAGRAWHAGDENGREERALFVVEEVARRGDGFQEAV